MMKPALDDDQLPLHDPEFSSDKRNEKRRGNLERVHRVALLVAILITTSTLLLAFCSWRYTKIYFMREVDDHGAKPPFNPPPFLDLAKTARYIAHYMDWAVITTISVHYDGIPIGIPISVSDGPESNGTGVPYIYITSFDPTSKDLQKNPKASFVYSEAQSDYCMKNKIDPEDPRCARLILSGEMVKVSPEEIPFAKNALFSRHPQMKDWPSTHNFYFSKLKITHVNVLDFFGPDHDVPLKDYFAAKI